MLIERAERLIRIRDGIPSVLPLDEDDDPVEKRVAVHRERYETPAYAFVLASLGRPSFPIPLGVFRAVDTPSYEALPEKQLEDAVAARGPGDLASLLHSGDTWSVEE